MGSVVKRITKPVRKIVKKIIPKEIKPFLPYIAASFGPATAGLSFGSGLGTALAQRGLIAAATSAATDEQGDPLRAGILAAAPGAIQGGLSQFGEAYGSAAGSAAGGDFSFLNKAGDMASKLSQNKTLQTLADPRSASGLTSKAIAYGVPASIDQAAKFAELNQAEIDKYNASLLSSGMNSKSDRRNAIYQIYMNTGAYEADEVNSMLDKYGYASGGIVGFANGGSGRKTRGTPMYTASMKKFFGIKDTDDEEEVKEKIKIKVGDTKEVKGEEERPIQITFSGEEEPNYSNLTNQALSGVETAFGRSFGEMEPVPMLRFAQGGDVGEYKDIPNIFNHSDDGGIMNKISESMERDYDYFTRIKMRENLKQGETMEDAADLSEQEAMDMVMNKYTKGGFARGGEVEIEEEQTEDLGIRDFMRDQGVEYGEQASYGFDDAMGETFEMFQDYRKKGIIPMEMEFDEFLELLQGRKEQGIQGTQVASGYKTDIEEMYEQYVFEMEEQGLQPMDFASYLRQAKAGMASGGRVNYAGGGASYNKSKRYSILIDKYNKGIPLSPSEADELEMLEMTYADQSRNLDMADGGIMNRNLLNTGVDKDMRGGGFIPEGTKEKADDVPARLSKNEFVMTADAVRAAGGGSVNQGAKRMYETMHKLEAKV